ncbi:hypothetical protein DTL42_00655 [Bremerella cremea]|uniref:Solute-binding protein family 5 domain-containing protein n=1 Tax=Bremerella cremea TaxID=1031537 RepID=A0A368KZM6_9BACT|nr:ABC transporter substrate-binding protein [Bremerella cremea]RCS55934.1 hypothetical protein DTL42_00655 [Bremerella cremea]
MFLSRYATRITIARLVLGLALGLSALACSPAYAADEKPKAEPEIPADMKKPLVERDPYDLITVKAGDKIEQHRIKPLQFEGGRPPANPTGAFQVELLEFPGRKFQISWKSIQRYQTFPQLLMEDANAKLKAKEFDAVFAYLQRMKGEYPGYPGIEQILEQLLIQNALERYNAGALDEALGMLEEAHKRFPNRGNTLTSIQSVAQRLVQSEIDAKQWASARLLMKRFEDSYGAAFAAPVKRWRAELAGLAEAQLENARQQEQKNDLRQALKLTELALAIDPTLPEAPERLADLVRRYPQVRIATLAPGEATPPHATLTATGRRNKRLSYRDLCEIVGYGPEGGEYISPYGSVLRPIDRFELSIVLRDRLTSITGFDLARQLEDPASQQDPILANLTPLIENLAVQEIRELNMRMRIPHVRPEALLGFVPRKNDFGTFPIPPNGPYRPLKVKEGQAFVPTEETKAASKQSPSEILLMPFQSSDDALTALRNGEVHMIDHLDPSIAKRMSAETPEGLVVDYYRAPTMHLLIPNLNHPYLKNRDFRRGLLYGIDRQEILNSRLLGGLDVDGCRTLSGPIPSGVSPDDPVSYGYDISIEPRKYEPVMSVTLRRLAEIQMKKEAEEDMQEMPKLEKLVIGHPNSEVSRQTCLALVQYYKRLALPVELKVVSPEETDPEKAGVDLLYVEVQIAEPLVDIPRLFQTYVPEAQQTQYFQLALRQLGDARTWQEVRERFWSFHRLAHDDLLIIPLFQMRDYFVYRRSLGGVGYQPMSLFQQVERWNIAPVLDMVQN